MHPVQVIFEQHCGLLGPRIRDFSPHTVLAAAQIATMHYSIDVMAPLSYIVTIRNAVMIKML